MLHYKTKPYDQQRQIVEAVVEPNLPYWALLCEMGTGKTKMSIDIASNLYLQGHVELAVVVAPKAVYGQWIDEGLPEHGTDYTALKWDNTSSKKYEAEVNWLVNTRNKMKWFAVNTEAFSIDGKMQSTLWKILSSCSRRPDGRFKALIIIDEASGIKNPTSKRSLAIAKWASAFLYRSILTGTPSPQSLANIWNLYETLQKNFWGISYQLFCRRHILSYRRRVEYTKNGTTRSVNVDTELDYNTWRRVKGFLQQGNIAGNSKYEELAIKFNMTTATVMTIEAQQSYEPYVRVTEIQDKIHPCTFTLKKEDCKDMPPKIFRRVGLTLSKNQVEALRSLKKENMVLHSEGLLAITTKSQLMTRAQQICGGFLALSTDVPGEYRSVPIEGPNPKLERLLLELEELGSEQAIVWAHFKSEQSLLAQELRKAGIKLSVYTHDTPSESLDSEKQKFVAGKTQVMLMSPNMGAYGINLVNATTQLWYSRGWSVEKRLQALDRSHRITSTKPVVYKDLIYTGTVDETILQALSKGQDINQLMMNMDVEDFFAYDK